MPAIQLTDISKTFTERTWKTALGFRAPGRVEALKEVSLSIQPGEIFGLIGPNGAGKTTLIKILATLILPDSGEASICGFDLSSQANRIRHLIGMVTANDRSFYWRLTGRQNLNFFASLWDLTNPDKTLRIKHVLDLVDLKDKADAQVMKYSSGQLQRLALARALLPDPTILLMDEPTRSLDPGAASQFRKLAKTYLSGKKGKTIIWCTHNLQEAKDVCNALAIIDKGRVVSSGSLDQIQSLIETKSIYGLKIATQPIDVIKEMGIPVSNISQNNGFMDLEISEPETEIPHLLDRLVRHNVKVFACYRKDIPLEQVFETLTNPDLPEPQIQTDQTNQIDQID